MVINHTLFAEKLMEFVNKMMRYGAKSYQRITHQTGIEGATPYQLIKMLLEGAISRIAMGKGHMERQEYDLKANALGKAIAIISALRDSLNHELNVEVTKNLDSLYEYMTRRILDATKENDTSMLEEVSNLLKEILEAWLDIDPAHAMKEESEDVEYDYQNTKV